MQVKTIPRWIRRTLGTSIILAPIVQNIGFLMHPEIFEFRLIEDAVELLTMLSEPGKWTSWTWAHVLVDFSIPLTVLAGLYMAILLWEKNRGLAFIGALLMVFGGVFMGGQFGYAFTESAIATMPVEMYSQAAPVLQTIMGYPFPMTVLWVSLALELGIAVLAVGLFKHRLVPRWAAALVIVGSLVITVFMDIDFYMMIGNFILLPGLIGIAAPLFKDSEPVP